MNRITTKQAKKFIPLSEDYSGNGVKIAEYFTLTPSDQGDGWEDVTYYTARKKGMYADKGEGNQWVYVLSNPTTPGLLKIGYTKATPEERAKQLSNATGVPLPYKVEWAFKCFNGEQLEGETHKKLSAYRVNNQREFFSNKLGRSKRSYYIIGSKL